MSWREAAVAVRMSRVALVAPRPALRDALAGAADAGLLEIDRMPASDRPPDGPAAHRLRGRPATGGAPALAAAEPDLDALVAAGRYDLLAGEAELEAYRTEAVSHRSVAALLGWAPTAALPRLSARLAGSGAAVVRLPPPRGVQPPTAARTGAAHRAFGPLVTTYAVTPYEDLDPTVPAAVAYVVMFGAMFGDLGHGTLLLLAGLLLRAAVPGPGWRGRLAPLRPHWLFVAAAGGSSALFGLAYGEFFGPTGLVSPLWRSPLEHPVPLLVAAIGLGAVLIAVAYAFGIVNRAREGGWGAALYSTSGVAGGLLFLAAGAAVLAWYHPAGGWTWVAAGAVAALALGLAFTGLLAEAGRGPAAVLQASVELVDTVVRLGANVVSFARLAAFGLTHAVLGWIVWQATAGLWSRGAAFAALAVVVFVAGNVLTAGLEGLVAGVQALRLEYYELFSRVFREEGRPFRPWHLPIASDAKEDPWARG